MNTLNHFPQILKATREMERLSMQDLADKTTLSKQAISKFEQGLINPTSDTLIKLSKALERPVNYFLTPQNIEKSIELASINHREKAKLIEDEFEVIKYETLGYIQSYLALEKVSEKQLEFKNPVEDIVVKSRKDVEKVVNVLRKKWNIGALPISGVIELLESKGIKVYEVFRSEHFEGFAAWAGKVPIIVINSSIKEKTRIRFTALHELGHILLKFVDTLSIDIIEKLCDHFSGELLFPSEAVVIELGNHRTKTTVEELILIKEKYGISVLAIMVGAVRAKVITWDTYNAWKKAYDVWHKDNLNLGEYRPLETPQRFNQLLYSCLATKKISIGKASALAKMDEDRFKKAYTFNILNNN